MKIRQVISENTQHKFVVTCHNSVTDNKETILIVADDEYDAKDKINHALGRGSMITDIRPARGDEPTDREYKAFREPRGGALHVGIYDREQGVSEASMSRAAKGVMKYGKDGMKALAKAGREGASEKKLDAIRDKHDQYNEGWSAKYKRSIDCSHPKGFSQKAHCAGKKKHNESIEMEMVCEYCGMCETHGDHTREIVDEACWKGYHKEGNKKMFGKTYPN